MKKYVLLQRFPSSLLPLKEGVLSLPAGTELTMIPNMGKYGLYGVNVKNSWSDDFLDKNPKIFQKVKL